MKDRLLDLCQKLPADYVEVRVQEGVGASIHFAGNELEDIGERTQPVSYTHLTLPTN